MEKIVPVGFGEYRISSNPGSVLVCFGLGSCVAVTLYDAKRGLGGMIHIVLPSAGGKPTKTPAHFADTGIPLLWGQMKKRGAEKRRVIVKVAGGAKIGKGVPSAGGLDVGERNVEMTLETLQQLGMPVAGMETGGFQGRTVRFYIASGETFVRHSGNKWI